MPAPKEINLDNLDKSPEEQLEQKYLSEVSKLDSNLSTFMRTEKPNGSPLQTVKSKDNSIKIEQNGGGLTINVIDSKNGIIVGDYKLLFQPGLKNILFQNKDGLLKDQFTNKNDFDKNISLVKLLKVINRVFTDYLAKSDADIRAEKLRKIKELEELDNGK